MAKVIFAVILVEDEKTVGWQALPERLDGVIASLPGALRLDTVYATSMDASEEVLTVLRSKAQDYEDLITSEASLGKVIHLDDRRSRP